MGVGVRKKEKREGWCSKRVVVREKGRRKEEEVLKEGCE